MSLPAPILDDRNFDDLYAEAQERIARYSRGEWTDFNDSDPGMTLVQLFAWLTETMLYQLNRVPDRNFIKFLELLNIRLAPARAATTPLTLIPRLSDSTSASENTVEIRTPFQAENPNGDNPLVFESTMEIDVAARPLNAIQVFNGSSFVPVAQNIVDDGLGSVMEFQPFGWVPQIGSALYLGFKATPAELETFETEPEKQIEGIFPEQFQFHVFRPAAQQRPSSRKCTGTEQPPTAPSSARTRWEYKRHAAERFWTRLDLFQDETQAFTRDGYFKIQGPRKSTLTREGRIIEPHFWLRCILEKAEFPGGVAPKIAAILPNTLEVENLETVAGEIVGNAEGVPDEFFILGSPPVAAKSLKLSVTRRPGENPEAWYRVDDFLASGPDDRHFVLDAITGKITFGDGDCGRIPFAGSEINADEYRSGGGEVGNVPAGSIEPQISLPFVESTLNFRPASGGRDAQSVDELKRLAPGKLRRQDRTVTSSDFAELASQAGGVALARAIPLRHPDYPNTTAPGCVTVVIIPKDVNVPPEPTPALLESVCKELDEKRLITTELYVRGPRFLPLNVQVQIQADPKYSPGRIKTDVKDVLEDHFNPLSHGAQQRMTENNNQHAGNGRNGSSMNGSHAGRNGSAMPAEPDYSRMLGGSFFPMKLIDLIMDVDGVKSAQLITIEIDGSPIEGKDYKLPRELSPDESLYLDTDFLSQNMTVIPPKGDG